MDYIKTLVNGLKARIRNDEVKTKKHFDAVDEGVAKAQSTAEIQPDM